MGIGATIAFNSRKAISRRKDTEEALGWQQVGRSHMAVGPSKENCRNWMINLGDDGGVIPIPLLDRSAADETKELASTTTTNCMSTGSCAC